MLLETVFFGAFLFVQAGLVAAIGKIDRAKYWKCMSGHSWRGLYKPQVSDWKGKPCAADRFQEVNEVYRNGENRLVIIEALDTEHPDDGTVVIKMDNRLGFARAEECFYYSVEPSPHIPEYYCSYFDGQTVYHVMERIQGTDLIEHTYKEDPEREKLAKILLRDIAPLIQSFYDQRFLHRDLKLENIMLKEETGTMVLVDYAFSAFVEKEWLEGSCTTQYAAPEAIRELCARTWEYPISWAPFKKFDLWGLGATLQALLDAQVPHYNVKDDSSPALYEAIVEGLPIDGTCENHSEFREIVKGLLAVDPEERKTIEELQSWIDPLVNSLSQ